jgi:hypothetical protein
LDSSEFASHPALESYSQVVALASHPASEQEEKSVEVQQGQEQTELSASTFLATKNYAITINQRHPDLNCQSHGYRKETLPRWLKPVILIVACGVAEATPFQNQKCRSCY